MDEWISATRCWSPSPSPDGTTIAFVWDGDGRPVVRMHERRTGREWSIDTGDELVSTVRWSPDGHWLGVEAAADGGERTNVFVVRPDGTDMRPVRGVGDDDRGAVSLDRWTHTGAVLAITESDIETTTAWLVDVDTDLRQRLGSGHALQILDVSRDRRRVLLRRGRRGSRHVGIVDLDGTEGWHEIDSGRGPGGPPGAVEHPVAITRDSSVVAARFTPDGSRMLILTDGGRERAALVSVDVATDARPMFPEVLAEREDAELERFALTEDAQTAALVWNVVGRSEVDLLDLTTGKPAHYAPPGDVVTSAVFSHDGDSLVLGIQAPSVPSAVWCHELSSQTTALICPHEEPHATVVHPTLETVTTPDGLALPGWLYRPRGTVGPMPTVIYLHGGPEAQERPVFTPLYQVLLQHGIAVYAANVRGSSGFGRSFVNADNGAGRFAAIRDVASCVEHLVGSGVADPARIGVMGRSYGGYLTLAALVNHPELFAVGVDVCGMADFETFFARTEPWIADAAVGEYGHPIHDRNLLRELSPVHRMSRLAAPLLVVHGRYDTNVPVHEAELAVHGAKSAGVDVRYLLFEDEGHEIQRLDNRRIFIHAVTDWLTAHFGLPGPR
ncbi:prolyl oligopeptidase family serine peptidase [Actinomycetospora sp. NBRC 106378]|uniref:S9 family peptidase n=1 Tax=Actinomycetospora sp. NBRC 106378 TaxID=3032208 RepID=UPI00249F9DEB|nr:prolyl oligopeptidase family serine peptidase [Actinomycetospora sp. NBRC 106378]GLZ55228.1 peptidase S9 [Actinomycetospora sp. NBRC 106378]